MEIKVPAGTSFPDFHQKKKQQPKNNNNKKKKPVNWALSFSKISFSSASAHSNRLKDGRRFVLWTRWTVYKQVCSKKITNWLFVYLIHKCSVELKKKIEGGRRKQHIQEIWGRLRDKKKVMKDKEKRQRERKRWHYFSFATISECFWLCELFITSNCDVSF